MDKHDLWEMEDRLFAQIARVLPCEAHAVYFPRDEHLSAPVWLPDENRLLLPLRQGDELLGVLMCRGFAAPERVAALLPELPAIAALCLDNLALYQTGRRDALTSLATRDVLLERVSHDVNAVRARFEHADGAPAEAAEIGLGLLVVRFAGIPELIRRSGNGFAEKLLATLAAAFREALPEQTLCARSGEYELAALLSGGDHAVCSRAALAAVHRLREVGVPDPYTNRPVGVLPCAGYVLFPQDLDGERLPDLMEPAAALLYKAGLAADVAQGLPAPDGSRIMAYGHLLTEGGRVRRLLPLACVEISLGRGEGAREGQRFAVWAPATTGAEPAYKGEVVLMDVRDTASSAEILHLGNAANPLAPGDALTLLPEERTPQVSTDEAAGLSEAGLLRHGDFLARLAREREGAASFALALVNLPEISRPADSAATAFASAVRLCREHFRAAHWGEVLGGRFALNSLIFFHREVPQAQLTAVYSTLCAELARLGTLAGDAAEGGPARLGAGLACWPFLHYHPGDMVECARKALEYALLLPAPHVGVFDSLAINISADKRHCRGDVFGALEEYKLALLADPDNALAWNSIGVCMAGLGRHSEARHHFEEALRRAPDDAALTYNLGAACQRLGDAEAARAHFVRCLELAPDHLFAALRLGQLAEERNELAEARGCYKKAAKANRDSAVPHRHLARIALKEGKSAAAREYLHQALLRDPRDAEALTLMARLYIEGGEDAELAESLARQSVALRPDRKNGWLTLAGALEARGMAREARAALLKAEEL